jgi:hypothetical protein
MCENVDNDNKPKTNYKEMKVMEWNTQTFENLVKEYENKVNVLEIARMRSDSSRHELYRKRNSGIKLTEEENNSVETACEYEEGITDTIHEIVTRKEAAFEALNNLKEILDSI